MKMKAEQERQAKRELVEDFKFRKEMEKQKNMQIEEFSKRQVQQKTQADVDRIRQREQEMFLKKHQMIQKKEEMQMDRAIKLEQSKHKLANKYEGKVQSKLHVETKAM